MKCSSFCKRRDPSSASKNLGFKTNEVIKKIVLDERQQAGSNDTIVSPADGVNKSTLYASSKAEASENSRYVLKEGKRIGDAYYLVFFFKIFP